MVVEAADDKPLTMRGVLALPGLRQVLAADVVSRLGNQLTTLAIPWFVLATTGSAGRMGVVFAVELLPVVILGVPSGSVVARFGARRVMIAGDVIQVALICLVPILHLSGVLTYWMLLVLVALTGAVKAPYVAAQRTLIPDVVGTDEAALTASNTLVESSTWTSRLAGPSIAGLIIAWLGALNLLWIDAGTFIFSALALLGLPRPRTASEVGEAAGGGDGGHVWDGLHYVLGDRVLRRLAVVATGYGLLIPPITLVLPVLAMNTYGGDPRIAGWLFGAWGVGAVGGSVVLMFWATKLPALRIGSIAAVGIGLPAWFLPLHQPALTVGVIMAVIGFFIPALNAPLLSLISIRSSKALLAQVMAVIVTANLVAGPAAYAATGWLFSSFGTERVLFVVAAGLTACAAGLVSLSVTQGRQ